MQGHVLTCPTITRLYSKVAASPPARRSTYLPSSCYQSLYIYIQCHYIPYLARLSNPVANGISCFRSHGLYPVRRPLPAAPQVLALDYEQLPDELHRIRTMTCSQCLRLLPYRHPLLRQRLVLSPARYTPAKYRCLSTTATAAQRRNDNFSTGYTNEYIIPAYGNGRGPIFDKKELHPLYPRDIKGRVDAYVVGQDKAKKAISTALFNHLKRCIRAEQQDERRRLSEAHGAHQSHPEFVEPWQPRPAEDRLIADRVDFQHAEFDHRYPAPVTPPPPEPTPKEVSAFIRDDASAEFVKIDKNNLLFLGPTGSGKTYLLEYNTMTPLINGSINRLTTYC
jgi:hypothetical protein